MHVVVIEPPKPAVSWEEARAHLRLDGDDEKTYVEGLVAAAQGNIDGPDGWLGRAIGLQTLECSSDHWPTSLPYRPVVDVVSAHVDDALVEGVRLEPDGLLFVPPYSPRGRVRIRYRAGYARTEGEGEAATTVVDVPAPIKQAILLLIGHWYAHRESVNVGNIVNNMPFAVDALLAPYRLWSL